MFAYELPFICVRVSSITNSFQNVHDMSDHIEIHTFRLSAVGMPPPIGSVMTRRRRQVFRFAPWWIHYEQAFRMSLDRSFVVHVHHIGTAAAARWSVLSTSWYHVSYARCSDDVAIIVLTKVIPNGPQVFYRPQQNLAVVGYTTHVIVCQ